MGRANARRSWAAALTCVFALALALGTALLPTKTYAAATSDPYKCPVTGITALASDKSNVPSTQVDNNVDVNDIENTYGSGVNGINVIVGSYTNSAGVFYYQYVAFDKDGVQTSWDAGVNASNVESSDTTWYVGTLEEPEQTTQTTEDLLAGAESATLPLNESVTLTDADAYQTKAGRTPNYEAESMTITDAKS